MKKNTPNLIRILLSIMIVSIIAMMVLWVPRAVSYAEGFLAESEGSGWYGIVAYVISISVAVVAVAVFLISFRFPVAIEKGEIFTEKISVLLRRISILVIADCILFGAGTVGLFVLGDRVLSPALAFADVIGVALFGMLWVLSKYVKDAAVLKEEADCTL